MGPYAGKQTGETALLWTLLGHFKRGDVVIADRLYTSYFMISALMHLGVDVVMRQHQTLHTDFRLGKRLGTRDHVVQWERPARPSWMDDATYAGVPAKLFRNLPHLGIGLGINPRPAFKDFNRVGDFGH